MRAKAGLPVTVRLNEVLGGTAAPRIATAFVRRSHNADNAPQTDTAATWPLCGFSAAATMVTGANKPSGGGATEKLVPSLDRSRPACVSWHGGSLTLREALRLAFALARSAGAAFAMFRVRTVLPMDEAALLMYSILRMRFRCVPCAA